MNASTPTHEVANLPLSGMSNGSQHKLELTLVEPDAAARFRAALERHMTPVSGDGNNNNSLGNRIMTRATNLASELKHDQQYVSKLLEQASRSPDSMHLMKAMLALNDYNLRVQFVSKTASKAASSVDQLTKLQ
jgi:hypothetical protein